MIKILLYNWADFENWVRDRGWNRKKFTLVRHKYMYRICTFLVSFRRLLTPLISILLSYIDIECPVFCRLTETVKFKYLIGHCGRRIQSHRTLYTQYTQLDLYSDLRLCVLGSGQTFETDPKPWRFVVLRRSEHGKNRYLHDGAGKIFCR